MKKILFHISLGISIILLIDIINILVIDFNRLMEYEYSYLIGKAILFFETITLLTKKHKSESKKENIKITDYNQLLISDLND